jgi:two-component system sensor histidine kinase UhpB
MRMRHASRVSVNARATKPLVLRTFRRSPARRGPSLFWRVFVVNALILVGDGLTLALAPPILSSPPGVADAVVVFAGLMLMLALNYVLMREAFRPLHRLRGRVAQIHSLGSEQHLPDDSATREVADLTRAFNVMLSRLERERRRSTLEALATQERERRRLSRELHDEVGQTLSAALLVLRPGPEQLPDGVRRQLGEAAELVREGMQATRRVAHSLRPEVLDELGLGTALCNLARRMAGAAELDLRLSVPEQLPPLPEDVELVIYRIAQEALTNVVRHAGASFAAMSVRVEAGRLRLAVYDDGCGLPAEHRDGAGIRGMRERALAAGAELVVRPGLESGTQVELTVPLANAGAAA